VPGVNLPVGQQLLSQGSITLVTYRGRAPGLYGANYQG